MLSRQNFYVFFYFLEIVGYHQPLLKELETFEAYTTTRFGQYILTFLNAGWT